MFAAKILCQVKKRVLLTGCLLTGLMPFFVAGQQASFPPEYTALKGEAQRVLFLEKVINDSINEGQLASVKAWSEEGLRYIDKLGMDSLRGVFLFYIAKAYSYYYSQYDSAIYYYKKVLPYYANDTQNKFYVLSLREIMENYSGSGNKDSTFVYVARIEAIMDGYPDTASRKISLSQNVATVYSDFGMFNTAVKYYQFAINGCLQKKNYAGLGMALANLGLVYNELADDEKAIKFSKEAVQYLQNNKRPLAQTLSNIGSYYYNRSAFDSARLYLEKSNALIKELDMPGALWTNQDILAGIYISEGKYKAARELLDKTLDYFTTTDDQASQIKTLLHLSDLDTSLHNYAGAKQYLEKVLNLSRKIDYKIFEIIALQNLTEAAKATGDYKSALAYHMDYMTAHDSLNNEKTRNQLAELEINYKTLQKEQQIELLQKTNDIKDLQLENNRRSTIFYLVGFILLAAIFGIFFYYRNLRNKINMQKMKAELETKVLRSQMNPHFIFNSLNSIENFMMQNEKRQASDYLNKFSKLIRSILESSRNELVPLVKDVEALQLYVDLEQLRFNNKFSYNTHVDPELITGDYQVPSLLIQPYVENAIVHGLAHSNRSGLQLSVSASLEDGYIKYIMQDNGIGRKKSAEYNEYNKPQHKSIGLKITEERIVMFNQSQGISGYHPVITDLWDAEGNPAGTRVEIKIKAA